MYLSYTCDLFLIYVTHICNNILALGIFQHQCTIMVFGVILNYTLCAAFSTLTTA